jgi:hypothetical protein
VNTITKGSMVLALLAGPVAAHADAVTFDFVGTVTYSSGSYSSAAVGSMLTGAYTFNFANENPAQSSGTIGTINFISGWSSQAFGGTEYGNALPTGLVFSTTLSGSGFSYSTPTIGDYGVSSLVQEQAYNTGSGGNPYLYGASEMHYFGSSDSSESSLDIEGAVSPSTSSGYPIISLAELPYFVDTAVGQLIDNGELDYTITSLTPVPLPASGWLLLSALGGLGAIARRKRAA